MYSIEGLKMLDRCSSGLSIFIGPTYDPKCTERRILSELGLDARIPFDTEWLVKEFDHKSNVEYISESHNWTSRENLVNRCLRLTDGTENSKNMLSELIFSMDAEELPVSRNLMIVYWKHT